MILTARSSQFSIMFESKMMEAHSNSISIQDISYAIFRFILYFLYIGDLDMLSLEDDELKDLQPESAKRRKTTSMETLGLRSSETSHSVDPLQVLISANRFLLENLSLVLEMALSKLVDLANVCSFLKFSEHYSLSTLYDVSFMYLLRNYPSITTTHPIQYQSLSQKCKDQIQINKLSKNRSADLSKKMQQLIKKKESLISSSTNDNRIS